MKTTLLTQQGNPAKNQYILSDITIKHISPKGTENFYTGTMLESYGKNIAFKLNTGEVILATKYWNYSRTTAHYRNIFLNESKEDTFSKIESGKYTFTDLN